MTSFDVQSLLSDLSSLRVRATYCHNGSVTFRNISLTHAVRRTGAVLLEEVKYVENATCPRNYTGLSCERCATGYKRENPHLGSFSRCVLCSCNGRSSECDPQSGNCTNCQIGTYGDKCQYCENNVLAPNCTECKAGFWGLSRTGCTDCSCHTPGTWYSNSTLCDKATGQCACNATMNVAGQQCDRCKENSYNASEGISDCRECSSCYAFLQTDVHQLRPQVTHLTNLTTDQAHQPIMQHGKTFSTRLQEIVEKVRRLIMKVSAAAANDSSFSDNWANLERQLVFLGTKVKVNLSSAVNASSDISSHVYANYQNINVTIFQINHLVNNGYRLLNTSIEKLHDTGQNYLIMLNKTVGELAPLLIEANRLLNLTLHHNASLLTGIDYSERRAIHAGISARSVEKNQDQFYPYLARLLRNATETKKLGHDANKMAEHRLRNATSVLNETLVLSQRTGAANPDNSKTVEVLNAYSSEVLSSSANYINQAMYFWNSSTTVLIQVYASIERAEALLKMVPQIEKNVTEQGAIAELANHIAKNATELANHIHRDAVYMRETLNNFNSMSKEAVLRANESLMEVFRIERGINEVLTNATSVNASIHKAVVASRRAVQVVTEAKNRTEDELKAIHKALERAKRLKNETEAKEDILANQTVRNFIKTEIKPVETLCQNLSNAAREIYTKASHALRQANETDTKRQLVINQIRQASYESSSLVLTSSENSLRALEEEIARVRQRFVNLNLEPSINQLRAKLQDHKGKHKEYKNKKADLKSKIDRIKSLIRSLKTVASQC